MEPFIFGIIGATCGAIVGGVCWGAVVRREAAAGHDREMTSVNTFYNRRIEEIKCQSAQHIAEINQRHENALFDLALIHSDELKFIEEKHAKEKAAEYQRGKESDGLVRDEKTGQMKGVKPKPVKARRFGDKVTGAK